MDLLNHSVVAPILARTFAQLFAHLDSFYTAEFLAGGGGENGALVCAEKFKVPRPLLRAMPTFKVPCPPCFDGTILTLRFVLQAFKLLKTRL